MYEANLLSITASREDCVLAERADGNGKQLTGLSS